MPLPESEIMAVKPKAKTKAKPKAKKTKAKPKTKAKRKPAKTLDAATRNVLKEFEPVLKSLAEK